MYRDVILLLFQTTIRGGHFIITARKKKLDFYTNRVCVCFSFLTIYSTISQWISTTEVCRTAHDEHTRGDYRATPTTCVKTHIHVYSIIILLLCSFNEWKATWNRITRMCVHTIMILKSFTRERVCEELDLIRPKCGDDKYVFLHCPCPNFKRDVLSQLRVSNYYYENVQKNNLFYHIITIMYIVHTTYTFMFPYILLRTMVLNAVGRVSQHANCYD